MYLIWEDGNDKITILKRAGKGILCLLSDLQDGVIRAQKGLDGIIKCSQCGMFVHVVINGEKIVVDLEWLRDFERASDFWDALLILKEDNLKNKDSKI